MLKSTIQNAPLLAALARLGQGDSVVIADVGFPCPAGVPLVDLALSRGLPTVEQALRALNDDVIFDGATMATEGADQAVAVVVQELFGEQVDFIQHEELEERAWHASVIVRTGETTPHAGVILSAGRDA